MADNKDKGFRQERKAAFNPGADADDAAPQARDVSMPAPPSLADVESHHADIGMEGAQGMQIQGNIPPQLQDAMRRQPMQQKRVKQEAMVPQNFNPNDRFRDFRDPALEAVLRKLQPSSGQYDEVILPSTGKFYTNGEGPADGKLHIRPMTGAEEQILATPRYVKKGVAVNKIFEQCIAEEVDPDRLLTVDRTYLLIYLRGISFTPAYDVDIQCPGCTARFQTTIDLNSLNVEDCPDHFSHADLEGVLPTSGLKFRYRLSTGRDEQLVTEHREKRMKEFGDAAADDTLLYRASLLIEEIEGVVGQIAIQTVISRLPINDVAHLRNLINEPPFGVNTKVDMICPSCTSEFEIDMPLEANFFFPRRNKEQERKKQMAAIQQ
jgi:hypothetical protein